MMRGDHDEVLSLLEHGADVNAAQGDGMTALHWAAANGDLDAAKWLVYAGANVHATTRLNAITPLWLAAQSGDALLVRCCSTARRSRMRRRRPASRRS